ncbi:MAG: hypothetical protein EXR75_09345 [Myxococcales bacterium]|nr:hypothetical protein [Myxococcales bacterium]
MPSTHRLSSAIVLVAVGLYAAPSSAQDDDPYADVPATEPIAKKGAPKPVVAIPKKEPPKPVVAIPKKELPKPVVAIPKKELPKPVLPNAEEEAAAPKAGMPITEEEAAAPKAGMPITEEDEAAPKAGAPSPTVTDTATTAAAGAEDESAASDESSSSLARLFDPATMPLPVWIAAGATALTGLGALVTGSFALRTHGSYDRANDGTDATGAESLRSRGQALNLTTDVLLGVTVAGLGATATLIFVLDREPLVVARALPWIAPGTAGVTIHARF